jgi:phenylpropionate dioxygenase-like ring-hydroxylating dioxygenase large terminal subunit
MSTARHAHLDVEALSKRWAALAVPAEGDNGVFTQSWFPICLSSEVAAGEVIGREFLDGRVVVVRGASGRVGVLSAYCPHVGADLAVGKVLGEELRCAFHHWQYDLEGRCVRTGIGDPPPPAACLFRFPSAEKYGIVWVFNGVEPLWTLPDFEKPESSLILHPFYTDTIHCDGWVFACNTPDMQHIKVVHGVEFKHADPHAQVNWTEWGFDYRIEAKHGQGPHIDWRIGITGSSLFLQQGTVDGWWLGVYSGFSLPRPGRHQAFATIAVERGEGAKAEARQRELLDFGVQLLKNTAEEDRPVLDTIRYRPRTLTAGDRSLSRYLSFLRGYPRAHPSAAFIK